MAYNCLYSSHAVAPAWSVLASSCLNREGEFGLEVGEGGRVDILLLSLFSFILLATLTDLVVVLGDLISSSPFIVLAKVDDAVPDSLANFLRNAIPSADSPSPNLVKKRWRSCRRTVV